MLKDEVDQSEVREVLHTLQEAGEEYEAHLLELLEALKHVATYCNDRDSYDKARSVLKKWEGVMGWDSSDYE